MVGPNSGQPSSGDTILNYGGMEGYDVDAPPWAQPPDEGFEALDRNSTFFGEFVWTGFDYLGEPTPYNSDVTSLGTPRGTW